MPEPFAMPAAPAPEPEPEVLVVATPQLVRRSETIGKLALALSKAQGIMRGAQRDSKNPFFGSVYSSLGSCWEACREALSTHELSVVQIASAQGLQVSVTTLLLHSSDEWIEGTLTMKAPKHDPQGVGSVVTYARRYGLTAMLGIAQSDDDAEEATHEKPKVANWDKGQGSVLQQAPQQATTVPPPAAPRIPTPVAVPSGTVPPPVGRPPARAPQPVAMPVSTDTKKE